MKRMIALLFSLGLILALPAGATAHTAHSSVTCCNFANTYVDDDDADSTYFLVGRVSSPQHACEANRKYIVTFEKSSEDIERHKIGSGTADSRGVIAWAIPHSKEDFDAGAYYRVEVKRSHMGGKKCGAAHGEKTSGV